MKKSSERQWRVVRKGELGLLVRNEEAGGSNPLSSTKKPNENDVFEEVSPGRRRAVLFLV